jgi:very-short-patch-repair endonuclease
VRHTKNYKSLPYNPALKKWAREMRQAGNLAEVLLWQQLKHKQLLGLDFDRQKIIGNYIADFYCAEKQVVIEVDGSSHDHKAEYDAQRDAFLIGLNLTVLHIQDTAVKKHLPAVIDFLRTHPALTTSQTDPNTHPQPSIANSPPSEGWQAQA